MKLLDVLLFFHHILDEVLLSLGSTPKTNVESPLEGSLATGRYKERSVNWLARWRIFLVYIFPELICGLVNLTSQQTSSDDFSVHQLKVKALLATEGDVVLIEAKKKKHHPVNEFIFL